MSVEEREAFFQAQIKEKRKAAAPEDNKWNLDYSTTLGGTKPSGDEIWGPDLGANADADLFDATHFDIADELDFEELERPSQDAPSAAWEVYNKKGAAREEKVREAAKKLKAGILHTKDVIGKIGAKQRGQRPAASSAASKA